MYAPTERFEAIFGEASGAHIGVILESEDILTRPYLRALAQLSVQVAQLHLCNKDQSPHEQYP